MWPHAVDAFAGTAGIGEQLARLAGYRRDPASTRGRTSDGTILTVHLRDKCDLAAESNGQKHVGFLMATDTTEEVHPLAAGAGAPPRALALAREPCTVGRWRGRVCKWLRSSRFCPLARSKPAAGKCRV